MPGTCQGVGGMTPPGERTPPEGMNDEANVGGVCGGSDPAKVKPGIPGVSGTPGVIGIGARAPTGEKLE